jgi:hypothetical protein
LKISKIFLYDEPIVPQINIDRLANFLKKTFSIDIIVRKNIFSVIDQTICKQLAACRVFNTNRPFELHFPSLEEIEFEKKYSQNTSNIKNIILYDGFELQKTVLNLIPENERLSDIFHLVFTNKLTCTYDSNDYRYHGRTIICSNPSLISTSGIIEAPAKPREYYVELISNMIQGLNLESVRKNYHGTYLEYNDERISSIVEGYSMQAVFYYLTGEPFCEKRECRLFNAHWQKDLIHSQIEIGKLCERHQKNLNDLVFNLNS